jgi:hypothetical protein
MVHSLTRAIGCLALSQRERGKNLRLSAHQGGGNVVKLRQPVQKRTA